MQKGFLAMKITFMGAGSTVFSKNVLGDTMLCPDFHDVEIALYDMDSIISVRNAIPVAPTTEEELLELPAPVDFPLE